MHCEARVRSLFDVATTGVVLHLVSITSASLPDRQTITPLTNVTKGIFFFFFFLFDISGAS